MPNYDGRGTHGQVVEAIGRAIVRGEHPEGATLDIAALQAEHGVSLTVVREALKVLAGKGLVGARQRRGTFVQPRERWNLLDPDVLLWEITPDTLPGMLDQLAEVRAIVEPAASALAASRRDEADLAAIATTLTSMEQAGDPAASTSADLAFHRAVLAATKNDLLARVELLTRSLFEERDRLVHEHVDGSASLSLHRHLFEAIVAGDPAAARRSTERIIGQAATDAAATVTGLLAPDQSKAG